jgi:hypothetical protein
VKIISRVLLAIGVVAAVGGIVSGELMYRDMRLRRLRSESHLIGRLSPGLGSEWKQVELPLVDSTAYCLAILVTDSARDGRPGDGQSHNVNVSGTFELRLDEPSGSTRVEKTFHGEYPAVSRGSQMRWVALDTIPVAGQGGTWIARFHASDPDTAFAEGTMVLLLSPILDRPYTTYLEEQTPAFLLRGSLILLGFFFVFAGGYLRRSASTGPGDARPGHNNLHANNLH